MKIKILIPVLVLAATMTGMLYAAGTPDEAKALFSEGNSSYSKEKFSEAIKAYEKALGLGLESGPLYYNLGNAYFKSNVPGRAILNYERAERLMPQDADLRSNLEYVSSIAGTAPYQGGMLARISLMLANIFTLDGITALTFVLYLAFSVLIGLFFIFKAARPALGYLSAFGFILFAVSSFVFLIKINQVEFAHEAIVVSKQAECRFEPFNDSTAYFTLREGDGLNVVTEKDGWLKIRISDGKQGWVKKEAVEVI